MEGAPLESHVDTHQRVVRRSIETLREPVEQVTAALQPALVRENKVLAFGNGGSAAQASHLVGELIGRFQQSRAPIPAIALGMDPSATTCISNDFGYEVLFERQVQALAQEGDLVFGFTTSGQTANVLRGLAAAKHQGCFTVALTGGDGLSNNDFADCILAVPSESTARVQEVHLLLIHLWCAAVEEAIGKKAA